MSEKTTQYAKIASAIYLITGFFSDQEPLKWRLRGLSADFVSEVVKDKVAISREIAALFGLARNAGLVSDINHDILVREINRISSDQESPLLPLFRREEEEIGPHNVPVEGALPRPQPVKDNQSQSLKESKPVLKEFGAVSVKKNSRQSIIIGLLKRKKEIMIKDVSPLIAGCSEKTIQRELIEMVSQGILKKIGEKRWTRYTLA